MQGIVIQGTTEYCREVAPLYKDIPNVVWSTWEDEPEENIEFIKQFIPVVLCTKPTFAGYLNINMQNTTTVEGILYLQEQGVTELLKTRGDLSISNIDRVLALLKGKAAASMVICKEGVRPLYYELEYQHFSHDYPDNLLHYGTIKNMINSFNFRVDSLMMIPPESLIAYHLLKGMEVEFKLEYKHLVENGVYFFMKDLLENNIEVTWLKHNQNVVQVHSNRQEYNY